VGGWVLVVLWVWAVGARRQTTRVRLGSPFTAAGPRQDAAEADGCVLERRGESGPVSGALAEIGPLAGVAT